MNLNKLPKIGQTVYWVNRNYPFTYEVKEGVITGVYVDEKDHVNINLDHDQYNNNPRFYYYSRQELWFSKQKAYHVAKNLLQMAEAQARRSAKRKETYRALASKMDEVAPAYLNKEVLVKVNHEDGTGRGWIKTKITELLPAVETNDYCFVYSSNLYLLKRENKTWKFYTEKLKLEMEKERLEKQLRELEEKLKRATV